MVQAQENGIASLYSDLVRRTPPGPRTPAPRPQDCISLAGGLPDPKSLPAREIAAATARALERHGEWALQYGASQGYAGLIEQLRIKLARDNGLDVGPDNVLITAGASQAMDLVCRALINPGDTVLSEEPTWQGAVRVFRAYQANVVGIPLDTEGVRLDILAERLAALKAQGVQPKLIYLIPTFQNPTGFTMPLHRRRQLLDLAKQYHVAVVEDDAYFDLRYAGERIPMLSALDDAGLTIYTGTFSKIMAAGMRIGWLIGPASLIAHLTQIKHDSSNMFLGHVVAEYMASGAFESHLTELVGIYRQRHEAMLDALATEMPEGVEWTVSNGGSFTWVTLPEGCDATTILAEARAHGVDFVPGTICYYDGRGQRNLRLCSSFADEEAIRRGIAILGGIIREYVPHR
jgi:2-aminoadipate transaminase